MSAKKPKAEVEVLGRAYRRVDRDGFITIRFDASRIGEDLLIESWRHRDYPLEKTGFACLSQAGVLLWQPDTPKPKRKKR